ncbi:MAG TPA: GntR family transcriptional regulator [Terracidiphilus sp.]|jgi:GntR family transcriptional regulator
MHSDIVISHSDHRPMYLQIMEQIKQRVAVGDWAPEREIPSIRQLAMDIRVSVITVKRAYLELEREGVIVTQHGKGSFVAGNPNIAPRLYDEEFSEHLEKVARLGDLLGLSSDEIARRTKEAANRLNEARLSKESL